MGHSRLLSASEGTIYALDELEQGALHNVLLKHTRQSSMLWNYHHKPLDAAIVRVSKLWLLVEPLALHSLERNSRISCIYGDAARFAVGSSSSPRASSPSCRFLRRLQVLHRQSRRLRCILDGQPTLRFDSVTFIGVLNDELRVAAAIRAG